MTPLFFMPMRRFASPRHVALEFKHTFACGKRPEGKHSLSMNRRMPDDQTPHRSPDSRIHMINTRAQFS